LPNEGVLGGPPVRVGVRPQPQRARRGTAGAGAPPEPRPHGGGRARGRGACGGAGAGSRGGETTRVPCGGVRRAGQAGVRPVAVQHNPLHLLPLRRRQDPRLLWHWSERLSPGQTAPARPGQRPHRQPSAPLQQQKAGRTLCPSHRCCWTKCSLSGGGALDGVLAAGAARGGITLYVCFPSF
ncbi:hypothetical protein EMIHUDRAFT_438683, partial [Emiliania huxleyi CCMP1516]